MAAIHVSRPGAYALASKLHRIPIAYPTEHWQDCSGEEGRQGYGPHAWHDKDRHARNGHLHVTRHEA